jgi:hypothetical protein
MIICYFWRDCYYRGKEWVAKPADAFWVEATQEEAETSVFPRLQPAAIIESRELVERDRDLATEMGDHARPFCFLVSRDLSSIDPFHVHYPVHPMWNAYSPFELMPGKEITCLEELQKLELPLKRSV